MEPSPHFNLDQAIAAWRDELASQHGVGPEDARILEEHLRDGLAELQRAGRSDAEAFQLACRQVGPPQAVAAEFAKTGDWRIWIMRRWVVWTALLYALALLVLTVPAILLSFGGWGASSNAMSLSDALEVYGYWSYWLWVGVLAVGQALFLLLPLNISSRRLRARRPLKLPVITSAFFLAILCLAGVLSMMCAASQNDPGKIFEWLDPFPAQADGNAALRGIVSITLVVWFVWTLVFFRFARRDDPSTLLKRLVRWMLRGSILELLVAVPSHVIVRRRDDCCAPGITFWGITVGISVMLLCFGPGIFFLFVERCRRLKPNSGKSKIAQ